MSICKSPIRVLDGAILAVVMGTAALSLRTPASAYETNVLSRDPSTVVKSGSEYWIYGTGTGGQQFSSKDRVHWTFRGPVFPNAPVWVAAAVPGNKRNNIWAPDIHFFNGKWHLYYSYSTFGSNVSAIGTAINNTLDPKTWVDQGIVVQTGRGKNYNAIDPCIFEDENHQPWLSFGSYFGGIRLMKIDPDTGKQSQTDTKIYSTATRPDAPPNAIEASAIIYHGGYYYLFVDFDACCAGPRSTYNIRMGRSKTVTGPYLDQTGKDMMDGGGSLFLTSLYDDGSGRLIDDEVGPGHFGWLHDTDGDWVSFHQEWARDKGGATTANLQRMSWDNDGWPRVVLDPGPYKILSNVATHEALLANAPGIKDGQLLHMSPDAGSIDQRWTLRYESNGYYRILGAVSLKALDYGAVAGRDVALKLSNPSQSDSQLWLIQQKLNGAYTIQPKSGDGKFALDIADGKLSDGAVVRVWDSNNLTPQEWSFHQK